MQRLFSNPQFVERKLANQINPLGKQTGTYNSIEVHASNYGGMLPLHDQVN